MSGNEMINCRLSDELKKYVDNIKPSIKPKHASSIAQQFKESDVYLIFVKSEDSAVLIAKNGLVWFDGEGNTINSNFGCFKSLIEQYEKLRDYDADGSMNRFWPSRVYSILEQFITNGVSSFDIEKTLHYGFVDLGINLRYSEEEEVKKMTEEFRKAGFILNKETYPYYLIVIEE